MNIRSLTAYEKPIVALINQLAQAHHYEYAAFLQTNNGPLIELKTDMRDDAVATSCLVKKLAMSGQQILVHHNHLSSESLSRPDWRGLTEFFQETFAYGKDGTRYYGRVIDKVHVEKVMNNYDIHQGQAETELFEAFLEFQPNPVDLGKKFGKEVLNRALRIRGWVDYRFCWGPNSRGKDLDHQINKVANSIQSKI